jgi:hypothetical protein
MRSLPIEVCVFFSIKLKASHENYIILFVKTVIKRKRLLWSVHLEAQNETLDA